MNTHRQARKYTSAITMLFMLFIGILCGCQPHDMSRPKARRVLIYHSYAENSEYCTRARELYERAFGSNIELVHLYANVPNVDYWESIQKCAQELHRLQRSDSLPEVVVLHGDETIDRYFAAFGNHDWSDGNAYMDIPVVFTGAICLDSIGTVEDFPQIPKTGFHDSIDWDANLQLAQRLWPDKPVAVELDFYRRDSLVKATLHQALRANAQYLDNSNFDYPFEGIDKRLHPEHEGKLLVNIVSFREKNTNQAGVEFKDSLITPEQRHKADSMMYVMLHNAKYICSLQTKLDIYSNNLIDHSLAPQLTAVNVQFGDRKVTRILGGYFVNLQTQVSDAASYVRRLLNGEDIADLPVRRSRAGLHLDWRAMELVGMHYDDWKDEADIVGVPMRVSNPVLWVILLILGILLLTAIVSSIFSFAIKLVHNSSFMRSIRTQQQQMEWILRGNNSAIWRILPDSVHFEMGIYYNESFTDLTHEQFLQCFHPDDREQVSEVLGMDKEEGQHSIRVRLLTGGEEKWIELDYNIDTHTQQQREMYVLAMDIDVQKRNEDNILAALQKSEETNLKQSFLANLTHDLRSPLAGIVGLADLITDDKSDMSDEERHELACLIRQNSDVMLKLLDDVSDTSRLQIGEYRFIRADVSVEPMIRSIYQTYKVLVPQHLNFEMEMGEACHVNVDQARITQVLNNFLSNAIKATPSGDITLGWAVRDDEVHLYVRDTGCGIDAEAQKHLFDKFFKADGKADGAGLGLSICKTMVEKQEGRIQVDSTPGKGSTFSAIFRRVATAILLFTGILLTGCQSKPSHESHPDGRPFNIALVHSYDSLQFVYGEFDNAVREQFEEKGLNVVLHEYFLDNDDYLFHEHADQVVRELIRQENCDLILCEGAHALQRIIGQYKSHKEYVQNGIVHLPVPVVAGNVNAPFWDEIRQCQNLRIWTSGTDPRPILPLIGTLTDGNVVEVELDYDDYSENIRRELSTYLSEVPYMNQLRMNDMRVLKPGNQQTLFADSMIILGISAAQPEMNGVNDPAQVMEQYNGQYEELTNILINYSVNYPQIVVKKDIWSRELAGRNHRPQFTLVPYDFGSYNTPYLAGYFPSMTTVAHDIVSTAAHILRGEAREARFCGRHQREMWMDYNAMDDYGLDYDDYVGHWQIVNVPMRLRNPWVFYGVPLLLLMVFNLMCYLLVKHYNQHHYKRMLKLQRSIGEGWLALLGTEAYHIRLLRNGDIRLEEFNNLHRVSIYHSLRGMVDQDHKRLEDVFYDSITKPGAYNMEIPLTFNGGKNYHWWRLTYLVSETVPGQPYEVGGVLINIDDRIQRNATLAKTREQIHEMERRERFLNNLNHEIRTPLNIILGFSEILSTPDIEISTEERIQLARDIRTNSTHLLSQVQDILDYSRIGSGRMKYNVQPTLLETLVLPLFLQFQQRVEHPGEDDTELAGKKLTMQIWPGRDGLTVMADVTCVSRILSQIFSNAAKFTPQGSISAGWRLDMQNGQVEVYIEDTGIGMARSTIRNIFKDFYKLDKMGVGIGLGLSICKAMAEGMGGSIEVNSAPDKGTRMSLMLKLA